MTAAQKGIQVKWAQGSLKDMCSVPCYLICRHFIVVPDSGQKSSLSLQQLVQTSWCRGGVIGGKVWRKNRKVLVDIKKTKQKKQNMNLLWREPVTHYWVGSGWLGISPGYPAWHTWPGKRFLRRLERMRAPPFIPFFYPGTIESFLTCSIISWHAVCTVSARNI